MTTATGTATFAAPVVATHGAGDPNAPLVVLLHGRGSTEQEILGLASHLPQGVEYAAVRAPIAEGGGFAWFANRGIGRPVASSLEATMAWFRAWLDSVAPAGRPVVLIGFSGGAAFAGGLVLADPSRFAGAAILYGTLPFDAGVPLDRSRLANLPVFVAQGESDHVIPRELLDRTWAWLHTESGAPTVGRRDASGHGLTQATVRRLAAWAAERLTHVSVEGAAPVGPQRDVVWHSIEGGRLPHRAGPSPEVHWDIPQQQQSQNAPQPLQERLFERVSALTGVQGGPSHISVPGARAFTLPGGAGPDECYLVPGVREFAHLHPAHDGSLHLALPAAYAADLVAHGWGVPHPWAGTRLAAGFVMLFGPRTEDELETVTAVVTEAHSFASGSRTA
ncbi:luciferase family protein [Phycicoccus sp. Soil748]|uniref:luciferase domain-containing protein n=1 Tax=Phycicoccus sp. Soil748 TaxID=1736397 RepID=UPI000702BE43|nr:luciferase family protein [Phycicoccus sp. Soil748]KRE55437.1 phospholipase [Phycicoccus sp. Soil748]